MFLSVVSFLMGGLPNVENRESIDLWFSAKVTAYKTPTHDTELAVAESDCLLRRLMRFYEHQV